MEEGAEGRKRNWQVHAVRPRSSAIVGEWFKAERRVHSEMLTGWFLKKAENGSSCRGSVVMNPTSIHEDTCSIPGLAQWVEDLVLP